MPEIEVTWGRGTYHCIRQRSTKVHPGTACDPKVLANIERPYAVQLEDPHQVLQLLVVHALPAQCSRKNICRADFSDIVLACSVHTWLTRLRAATRAKQSWAAVSTKRLLL